MGIHLSFFVSFLAVLFFTPFLRAAGIKWGVLDFPNDRKIHKVATPLLGGLAVFLGVILVTVLNMKVAGRFLPVTIASFFILAVGLIDDIKGLSAQVRLLAQSLIALAIIFSGIRIDFLPQNLWGNVAEIIITLIWIVGLTNAYNYLDGMDGLAAGSAVINLFFFAIILHSTGQYFLTVLVVILIGACSGFLPYNLRGARIFLGESGSTFLGFSLACIAIMGNWAQDNIVKISIPVLILGVPIFDMIFTTIIRFREEKVKTLLQWLQYGGRDHFHHYLVDLGLMPFGAVAFIYCITFSLGISAVMVSNDKAFEAFLALSQAAIIFGVIATLIVVGKRRRSGWRAAGHRQ